MDIEPLAGRPGLIPAAMGGDFAGILPACKGKNGAAGGSSSLFRLFLPVFFAKKPDKTCFIALLRLKAGF